YQSDPCDAMGCRKWRCFARLYRGGWSIEATPHQKSPGTLDRGSVVVFCGCSRWPISSTTPDRTMTIPRPSKMCTPRLKWPFHGQKPHFKTKIGPSGPLFLRWAGTSPWSDPRSPLLGLKQMVNTLQHRNCRFAQKVFTKPEH